MQNVPDWVRKQMPKYNRMFHTTDPHSRRTSYYLDGRNVTYRISFARVHGGADVRISRTLRGNSGAVSNEPPPDHGGQANASYYTPPQFLGHETEESKRYGLGLGRLGLAGVIGAIGVAGALLPLPLAPKMAIFAGIFVLGLITHLQGIHRGKKKGIGGVLLVIGIAGFWGAIVGADVFP